MNITTATLVAVLRRALDAVERPLLFHETKTPKRAASRLARLERWAGPMGAAVARDYIGRRHPPGTGPRMWKRSAAA